MFLHFWNVRNLLRKYLSFFKMFYHIPYLPAFLNLWYYAIILMKDSIPQYRSNQFIALTALSLNLNSKMNRYYMWEITHAFSKNHYLLSINKNIVEIGWGGYCLHLLGAIFIVGVNATVKDLFFQNFTRVLFFSWICCILISLSWFWSDHIIN